MTDLGLGNSRPYEDRVDLAARGKEDVRLEAVSDEDGALRVELGPAVRSKPGQSTLEWDSIERATHSRRTTSSKG
jgi:hypothetical protein